VQTRTPNSGRTASEKPASPAKQLATFIAKFDPAVARLARDSRRILRRHMPAALELVYDNYNALAIGFSPTERPSDCIVSLAVYARNVNLYFMHGKSLPDPHTLLQGKGNQGRFFRIETAADLERAEVTDLLFVAIRRSDEPLPTRGDGRTIIKSISAKQRPRRFR
jgi:hypothetical protein